MTIWAIVDLRLIGSSPDAWYGQGQLGELSSGGIWELRLRLPSTSDFSIVKIALMEVVNHFTT